LEHKDYIAIRERSNLQLPMNSILVVLSPNGAGKTTAIKLFLDLIRTTLGGGIIQGHDFTMETKNTLV